MDYNKVANEAEARRVELLQEMNSLETLISSAKHLANLSDRRSDPTEPVRVSASNPTREITAEILRARGKPIKTVDLLPLLIDRGVEVGGKDSVATLSARLSNSDEFRSNRRVGWWFKGEPLPGAYAMFEESEGDPATEAPSDPNHNKGGPYGTAIALDDPTEL